MTLFQIRPPRPAAAPLATVLVTALVLSACQTTTSTTQTSRVVIAPADSEMLFVTEPGDPMQITYRREQTPHVTYFSAVGRVGRALFPHLSVRYLYVEPGRYFNQSVQLADYVEHLNFAKTKNVTRDKERLVDAALGRINVLGFQVGSAPCAAFEYELNAGYGHGTSRMYGHHCWQGGATADDRSVRRVLDAIAIKDRDGWLAARNAVRKAMPGTATRDLRLEGYWQNVEADIGGKLVISDGKARGGLWFALPGRGDCSGEWRHVNGSFKGGGPRPTGTWSALCTNGIAAKGGFASIAPYHGIGFGKDGDGNRIAFRYGTSRPGAPQLETLEIRAICHLALSPDGQPAWGDADYQAPYVAQAKSRDLTAEACAAETG